MSQAHKPEVLQYLRRDTLRHIVHLKALESYSAHIRSHYFSDGTSAGVLFVYPTSVTTYESMKYPQTRYVVLSSSDSPSVTQQLLVHFPTDGSFILKLTNGEDKAVVERKFALNRITSFLSYTNPARVTFARSGMVRTSAKLDERLLPLFRQNGYEREEVVGYFNSGTALSFAIEEKGEPASACMAYRNWGEIWEIAALYTTEMGRRKGYAKTVVETALERLLQGGHVPRYQVDEGNLASKALAEKLGLTRFLQTEHYLSRL